MKVHYSQLDLFQQCPVAYKRRYIDGIQDPEKSSALEYGQAIHLAIKTHFEGGDGLETFNMYWNSLKNVEMKYYRHGWDELRNLANTSFLPNFFRLHAKYYVNPKMEELCESPLLPLELSLEGTFDMCSEYKGELTMSDWKTSTKEYKKDKIRKSPQLWIYAYMYQQKYGVLPKNVQYKIFRKDSGSIQTLEIPITQEELDRQMESVRRTIKLLLHTIENNLWFHHYDCWCNLEGEK